MARPDCSIDFARRFSLPVAVPPAALPDASLATWLAGLDLRAQFLVYDRTALLPFADLQKFDPVSARSRRVRLVDGAGGKVVLPSSTMQAPPTTAQTLTEPQIDKVGRRTWAAAKPIAGRTMAQVAAARFRWDAEAREASSLPLPMLTDESLVLFWRDAAARPGLLSQAIPGVLAAADSPYLLATSTTARDGELDRLLLRAPATGLVRFERYRHLVLKGTDLEVSHPSRAGALVLRLPATGLTQPEKRSPLFAARRLVFEHVDLDSAVECLASLVVCQLQHAADVLALKKFDQPFVRQASWLLRAWLAWLKVVRPTVRPAAPDPSPAIPKNLREPFEGGKDGSKAQVTAFLEHLRGNADARASLVDYVREFHAPVLCGRSWRELGVDLPVDPATRPPQLKLAHATLEALTGSSDTWLVAYAGCPLGRPSRVYVADPTAPPEPSALPFEALSVVELEALAVAGKTADVVPGVTPGPLPDPLDPIDLTPFAGSSPGRAAVFRTVDAAPPKQEYTTVDWLGETIKGARYQQELPPPVEFGDLAGGHALIEPLGWAAFHTGGGLRAGLDALHAATVGGRRLDDAIVDWWVAEVNIGAGGRWPVALPGAGGPPDLPAGPQRPFVDAATRPVGTASGLDAFDLAAVQAARALMRDGRDETAQVELPLFLAVMDREGYRTNGGQDRVGNFGDQGFRDHPLKVVDPVTGLPRSIRRADFPPAVTGLGQAFLDNFARVGWIVFPYGLDIFNQGVNAGNFLASVASSFTDRLTFLQQERVLAASVDPAWAHAFALDRLRGRAFGVDAVLQNQRRSRRLQWLGILCQQAEFQQRHKALSNAFQLGNPFDEVDELVSGVRPQPGPDANSPQRKAYLAYWALVYLAFNVLPSTWNAWVQGAEAARDKVAGETVGAFLLYHTNADPLAVEPPRPPPDPRRLFQRANMLRFAVALDAYLRVDPGGAHDTSDPAARAW